MQLANLDISGNFARFPARVVLLDTTVVVNATPFAPTKTVTKLLDV